MRGFDNLQIGEFKNYGRNLWRHNHYFNRLPQGQVVHCLSSAESSLLYCRALVHGLEGWADDG